MRSIRPHLSIRILFANPGEELFHAGVGLELIDGVEVGGQFFVGEQDMDLLMAGLADVGGGADVLLLALGVLTGNQVVDGELGAGAIAQFTYRHFTSGHKHSERSPFILLLSFPAICHGWLTAQRLALNG